MTLLLFAGGIVLLVIGAEALVRGATQAAERLGISPLVVGLTVVAFGTSAPELAVSLDAVWSGEAALATGNAVGSNIFNVLGILGAAALITPLSVSTGLIRRDVPLLVLLSAAVWLLAADGAIGRVDGALLVTGLVVYTATLIRASRAQSRVSSDAAGQPSAQAAGRVPAHWARSTLLVAGGLGLLVLGSRLLVGAASAFASALGVSDLVIGLTVVAMGTSLPELVTSVVAALRGERDVAVGNVVGSNLFNLMGVLGLSAVAAPTGLGVSDALLGFDIPLMGLVALACLPIFFTGGRIARVEGLVLLIGYAAYTTVLLRAALAGSSPPSLGAWILLPALGFAAVLLWSVHVQRKRASASAAEQPAA
jgi:cation:H+ antiporter